MKSACRAIVHPRRTIASFFRAAYYFFLVVGILALGYAGYVVVDASRLSGNTMKSRKFEAASLSQAPRLLVEGGVIGEDIQVARLHLKAIVVQGDSHTLLRRAVGPHSRYGPCLEHPATSFSPAIATLFFVARPQ